jgi:amylosucrase
MSRTGASLALSVGIPSDPWSVYNVTAGWRSWSAVQVAELGLERPFDAVGSRFVEQDDERKFWLPPFGAWWLVEHQ